MRAAPGALCCAIAASYTLNLGVRTNADLMPSQPSATAMALLKAMPMLNENKVETYGKNICRELLSVKPVYTVATK